MGKLMNWIKSLIIKRLVLIYVVLNKCGSCARAKWVQGKPGGAYVCYGDKKACIEYYSTKANRKGVNYDKR